MSPVGATVALLGATGVVGEEVLSLLQERRLPVSELRLFASEDSVGIEIDFLSEPLSVEPIELDRIASCDLVINAAANLEDSLLDELCERGAMLVDLSGALERDESVPLYVPGLGVQAVNAQGAWRLAVPRGIAAGLALTLQVLAEKRPLSRVTALTLEAASGVGRRGLGELSDQTVAILNAMSGSEIRSNVFPAALAFDCLPVVGDLADAGETSEEHALRRILRRVLRAPQLQAELTRVRVPIFMGSLAAVHVEMEDPPELATLREIWGAVPPIEVLEAAELPTPRTSVGTDSISVGRVRCGPTGVAYVLAMDDLRRGAALTAIEAAAALLAS